MKNCSIDCHFLTHCMCLTDCVYLQCSGWKSVVRLRDVLCFNPVWYGRIRTLLTVASHCVTPQATTFILKGCQGAYLRVLTVSFVGQACALSPSNTKEQREIKTFICSTERCSAPLLFSFLFFSFFLNATISVETALKFHCRISRLHLFGSQTLAQGHRRWTHLTFCEVDVSISLACAGLTVLWHSLYSVMWLCTVLPVQVGLKCIWWIISFFSFSQTMGPRQKEMQFSLLSLDIGNITSVLVHSA